jgi:hypothetical protein
MCHFSYLFFGKFSKVMSKFESFFPSGMMEVSQIILWCAPLYNFGEDFCARHKRRCMELKFVLRWRRRLPQAPEIFDLWHPWWPWSPDRHRRPRASPSSLVKASAAVAMTGWASWPGGHAGERCPCVPLLALRGRPRAHPDPHARGDSSSPSPKGKSYSVVILFVIFFWKTWFWLYVILVI